MDETSVWDCKRCGGESVSEGLPDELVCLNCVEAEAVEAVEEARDVLGAAEAELRARVAEARSAGATWATIGAVLGVTRQAAHERFSA